MPYPHDALENRMYEAVRAYRNGNKGVIDEVFSDVLPFCLRVASKTCDRYIHEEDEEASIAGLSILEAFEKYDPDRGSFLPYLGRVVRTRIIDYKRREKKHAVIPFSHLIHAKDVNTLVDDSFFDDIIDELDRKNEIENLRIILAEFDISFAELARVSPAQNAVREKAKQVIHIISSSPELSNQVLEKKMLPAKTLRDTYNINTKLLDRYRKYIIAGVIIMTHEFSSLAPYVLPSGGKIDGQ